MTFQNSKNKILAIETSCDETAAAVVETEGSPRANRGRAGASRLDRVPEASGTTLGLNLKILSNVVSSQIEIHKKFGGVFPEHASRAHSERIIGVVEEALGDNIPDAIAVTIGPGLIGSLLIGVNFAKTYSYVKNLPIIGINHWLGHMYSVFNGANPKSEIRNPKLPALFLIVSGGHTGLVLMKSHREIQTLGETLDDAAGEAFDKVAKLLGLDYPGGPAIAACAAKIRNPKSEIRNKSQIPNLKFPRSMLDRKDYDFSFSGLKTAVLYKVKELESQGITINHAPPAGGANHYKSLVAYEFQQAVIDILIGKTLQAAKEFKPKSICLCGGVSANKELRVQMAQAVKNYCSSLSRTISFHVPPLSLSTDNAAMIGIAAAYQISTRNKQLTTYDQINADSNLKLG